MKTDASHYAICEVCEKRFENGQTFKALYLGAQIGGYAHSAIQHELLFPLTQFLEHISVVHVTCDEPTRTDQSPLEKVKELVTGWSTKDQQALYVYLHGPLGRRI